MSLRNECGLELNAYSMIVHMGRQVGCMRRNRISRTAGGAKVKFALHATAGSEVESLEPKAIKSGSSKGRCHKNDSGKESGF